jgi:hypothetical protein
VIWVLQGTSVRDVNSNKFKMGKSPHAGQDITWLLEIIEAEKQKTVLS